MTLPSTDAMALVETIRSFRSAPADIRQYTRRIHRDVLAYSRYIREADFTAIHPRDLEFLLRAYDSVFFAGNCQGAMNGQRIRMRLSERMTSAGGKTSRFISRNGEAHYEIAIANSMLFDNFSEGDRHISVGGIQCENRLDALQRIFEHELVHLVELLCWETSNCEACRFQDLALRLFLHRTPTHALVTRQERAANSGIRLGSHVTFEMQGVRLRGCVRRITRRATVLVKDPCGQMYSDGLRYRTYYVPLSLLRLG